MDLIDPMIPAQSLKGMKKLLTSVVDEDALNSKEYDMYFREDENLIFVPSVLMRMAKATEKPPSEKEPKVHVHYSDFKGNCASNPAE